MSDSKLVRVEAEIAGLPLEVVDNEWVTLRSLFEPFGKRVGEQIRRLQEWADLRKLHLTARASDNDFTRLETWTIHRTQVAQAIAELDPRGMSDEVREAFVRFKRECASALDAYFNKGVATNPRLVQPGDPWAAIQQMAAAVAQIANGAMGLQRGVEEAKTESASANEAAKKAEQTAREAKEIASQARTLAGVRGMLDAIATSTPAGGSTATPDGAWSSKAPDGYRSMRAVARDYALPSDGVGCGFVGKVARALGVYEDLEAVAYQDVVIGGRARRQHVVYGPKAIQALDAPLRAAHAAMTTRGYTVKHGAMLSATLLGSNRSKDFVLQEMFETAVSGSQRDIDGRQTTIPGLVEERKAG